jgi:hypothetical protein
MVRRRCRTIIVSDAGADPDCALEDLGNALRKISIDLGVRIDFEPINARKRGPDPENPGVYYAIGHITYPEIYQGKHPTGTIIYIKPGFYKDAPADVRAYAAANAKFPHDTTLNQWFNESQFESYRTLGSHVIKTITSKRDDKGNIDPKDEPGDLKLKDFIGCVRAYLEDHNKRAGMVLPVRLAS